MKQYKFNNSGEDDISTVLTLTLEQVKFLRAVIRQLNGGHRTGNYPPYLWLGKGSTIKNKKQVAKRETTR